LSSAADPEVEGWPSEQVVKPQPASDSFSGLKTCPNRWRLPAMPLRLGR